MKLEGAFDVAAPREAVYRHITDPGLMARCVPGCEEIERLDATRYRARVAVGMASLNVRFDLVVQVMHEEPPAQVLSRTRGEEGSRASVLAADNSVTLTAIGDSATCVRYASEVSITGRLGKFALGVMTKKLESLGTEFAARFRREIDERLRSEGAAARVAEPGAPSPAESPASGATGDAPSTLPADHG